MSLGLVEAAISALHTYLSANMATKVTALNTEYGDDLLEDMKTWYQGVLPRELPEYPCCCLYGEAWEPMEQRGVNIHVANKITIIVFVADADELVRWQKLNRYGRAMVELLHEGESSFGYEHELDGEIAVSDSLAVPPFIQAISVPVALHKLEAY